MMTSKTKFKDGVTALLKVHDIRCTIFIMSYTQANPPLSAGVWVRWLATLVLSTWSIQDFIAIDMPVAGACMWCVKAI
jgi:hypothetical protein